MTSSSSYPRLQLHLVALAFCAITLDASKAGKSTNRDVSHPLAPVRVDTDTTTARHGAHRHAEVEPSPINGLGVAIGGGGPAAEAAEVSARGSGLRGVQVTLSNTALPTDTQGHPLRTGEVDVLDNHQRDGYATFNPQYSPISNACC